MLEGSCLHTPFVQKKISIWTRDLQSFFDLSPKISQVEESAAHDAIALYTLNELNQWVIHQEQLEVCNAAGIIISSWCKGNKS